MNCSLSIDEGLSSLASFVDVLNDKAYRQMKADTRVVRAVARWSACMESSGYRYPNPAAANDDPRFATIDATPLEIAVAMADAACKKKVNLIDVMAAVETAYQNLAIADNRTKLHEARKQHEDRILAAQAVIAG